MPARFEFLGPLKQLVEGQDVVEVEATSVGGALEELQQRYSELSKRLLAEDGTLHRHINIFVNEEDIRFRENLQTALTAGDQITVISAIAGG
ncbi:MAG: MoaD/ThiS family protein [Fidelibacterota bacterium]|nr:MAG: MoaD/ThiS family protein [Candidatus Neomarinimicrobiota bacterium]